MSKHGLGDEGVGKGKGHTPSASEQGNPTAESFWTGSGFPCACVMGRMAWSAWIRRRLDSRRGEGSIVEFRDRLEGTRVVSTYLFVTEEILLHDCDRGEDFGI